MENQQQKAKRPGRPRKPTSERKDKRIRITLNKANTREVENLQSALDTKKASIRLWKNEPYTWADCLALALRRARLGEIESTEGLVNALLDLLFHLLKEASQDDKAQLVLLYLYNFTINEAIREDSARLEKETDGDTRIAIETMLSVFEGNRQYQSAGIQFLLDIISRKIKK